MKKWLSIVSIISIMLCCVACGNTNRVKMNVAKSNSAESDIDIVSDNGKSKILIAYFTWADNTVVEDEEEAIRSALKHYEDIGDSDNYSDVDAVSSARVVSPGNTEKMAQWIQQYVGGDLFPITVTKPYSSDYDECMNRAADEKANEERPELATHLDNMDDYDIVFLGFPNWWYTAPMLVFSFIDEYDLSGKTIIPFCTHGTGGIASSVKDITAALPDTAKVLEPIGVYRADINQAQSVINEWLQSLGFSDKKETVNAEKKIKITVGKKKVMISLYDSPAANALYERLPMELKFEDFNNIEKISYLSDNLPTEGEPEGCDPKKGDFCYYEPWGNLSVFYQDFKHSNGLIPLGHVDSGMNVITDMTENSVVTMEAINDK